MCQLSTLDCALTRAIMFSFISKVLSQSLLPSHFREVICKMSELGPACVRSQINPWISAILSLVSRWQSWPVIFFCGPQELILWAQGAPIPHRNTSEALWSNLKWQDPPPHHSTSLYTGGANQVFLGQPSLITLGLLFLFPSVTGNSHFLVLFFCWELFFSWARGSVYIQHSS